MNPIHAYALVEEFERQHPGWTLRVRYCGHFEGMTLTALQDRGGADASDICWRCAQADQVRRSQQMAADRT